MSLREEILYDKLHSKLAIYKAELAVLEKYNISQRMRIEVLLALIKEIEVQLTALYAKQY